MKIWAMLTSRRPDEFMPVAHPAQERYVIAPAAKVVRTFAVAASEAGVRCGLGRIRAFLFAAGLSDETCGTAEIILAEALNDVAEHAYAGRDAGSPNDIEVMITLDGTTAAIKITDSGAPLPGLRPPEGHPPPLEGSGAGLPEGGFGWFLIRSLTTRLSYMRQDNRNMLKLSIDAPAARLTAPH